MPGLIAHDPWKPDEAYSFGLVYSLVNGGSWVVPTLAGAPFMEKPPLYYLTAAATARTLSSILPLHDAARLATAFYLALTAFFVALTADRLYGARAAPLAVVGLIGCLGLVVRAHQLITDVALLAGFAVALYGLAVGSTRPVLGGAWLGTGAGIGFMAKGLLAPGILAIVALSMPLCARVWRRRNHLRFVCVAAFVVLPWIVFWPAALYTDSPALVREWFVDNNLGRFLGTNDLGPPASPAHYWRILPWYAFPVLPLAIWSVWLGYERGGLDTGTRLLLLHFVATLAVLSISADARELYAMPMLLPLAILATSGLERLPTRLSSAWLAGSMVVFGTLLVCAWLGWFYLVYAVPHPPSELSMANAVAVGTGPHNIGLIAAVGYTVGWIVMLRHAHATPCGAALAWSAGVTAAWALAMTLYLPWIDSAKTLRPVFASLHAALPPHYRCIGGRDLGESERAMLHYFAGILTTREQRLGVPHACDLLLIQRHPTTHWPSDPALELLREGARGHDTIGSFRLYRRRG